MAQQAARYVQRVIGVYLARPPIFRMSCSWWQARITEPDPRKRQALKNACVIRWKMPAQYTPTPTLMNMKPSWLTVEYARTFLMSYWKKPIDAANSAVRTPTTATTVIAGGLRAKRKLSRATM